MYTVHREPVNSFSIAGKREGNTTHKSETRNCIRSNVGIHPRFSARGLLLEVLDAPEDEAGQARTQQRRYPPTPRGGGAAPQHGLLLQPEGQGVPGRDRPQTQVHYKFHLKFLHGF